MSSEFAEATASAVIKGVYFVDPKPIEDPRGRFLEIYRTEWINGARPMVQSNRSFSRAGVLRGMHYHLFQADYWYFSQGEVFVCLYDARASSSTAEKVETFTVKDGEDRGIYIPPGVAHGFFAVSETSLVYMVDQAFDGTDELGFYYEDAGVEWPTAGEPPILSERDSALPNLLDIADENIPF
jgi:dTDP-4-dehydrorhamnose 3,5-epimerase